MADPKLAKTRCLISYSGDDGYHSSVEYASRGETPPKDVFLEALQELARLTALFGFEDEAQQRFDEARKAVFDWREERSAAALSAAKERGYG